MAKKVTNEGFKFFPTHFVNFCNFHKLKDMYFSEGYNKKGPASAGPFCYRTGLTSKGLT